MSKASLRTHERVENLFCPTCNEKKGHKLVETKRPFWVHLILIFCTSGIGYLFVKMSKWSKMCSACGRIN